MNHEILTNELDENTKLLIEKMEKELNSKDEEIRKLKNESWLLGVKMNFKYRNLDFIEKIEVFFCIF